MKPTTIHFHFVHRRLQLRGRMSAAREASTTKLARAGLRPRVTAEEVELRRGIAYCETAEFEVVVLASSVQDPALELVSFCGVSVSCLSAGGRKTRCWVLWCLLGGPMVVRHE